MKIIVVVGYPNTGKTTVICKVFEKITGRLPKSYPGNPLDYQDSDYYKKKKISISSAGDNPELVKKSIAYGRNNNCDILVMAISRPWNPGWKWQYWFKNHSLNTDTIYWCSSNFPAPYTLASPPAQPSWGTPSVDDLTELLANYIVDLIEKI